jgi:hypothetical protein
MAYYLRNKKTGKILKRKYSSYAIVVRAKARLTRRRRRR